MPPDPPWQDITKHGFFPTTDTALPRVHHIRLTSLRIKLHEDGTELTRAILALYDKTVQIAKEANKLTMFRVLEELTATVSPIPSFCPTPAPTHPPTLSRYQFAATALALHERAGPRQWPCHDVSCAPISLSPTHASLVLTFDNLPIH
eukprot:9159467-Ditylum_brightwellii.AAC.1